MNKWMKLLALTLPMAVSAVSYGEVNESDKVLIQKTLGNEKKTLEHIADSLWDWAELGYKEEKSTSLMQSVLAEHGFKIQDNVAGMPTAFVASYGTEGPVIGILAEMDALPGLSQKAVPYKAPAEERTAGHACGHHLFAGGSIGAALAIKAWLDETGQPGQVRVFGTPAEEGGSGKVYMARAGLFDDVDVVLHWHPGDSNSAQAASSLANKSAKFRFSGVAAHAAAAPERGRSALDAVEAMNMMVNMMREHVPDGTRIHYIITNGGAAPNIVPDAAEVYYYVRSPKPEVVQSLWARLEKIANAAAMGTETEVDWEVVGGVWNLLPNLTLAEIMDQSMRSYGGIVYTDKEEAFAQKIRPSLGKEGEQGQGSQQAIVEFTKEIPVWSASTDVGDVSWQVPTAGLSVATWVPGTPPHSWQAVAAGGMSIGHKGMMLAAETIALTAVTLFERPTLIEEAKSEFSERTKGIEYRALVGDRDPALNYRD